MIFNFDVLFVILHPLLVFIHFVIRNHYPPHILIFYTFGSFCVIYSIRYQHGLNSTNKSSLLCHLWSSSPASRPPLALSRRRKQSGMLLHQLGVLQTRPPQFRSRIRGPKSLHPHHIRIRYVGRLRTHHEVARPLSRLRLQWVWWFSVWKKMWFVSAILVSDILGYCRDSLYGEKHVICECYLGQWYHGLFWFLFCMNRDTFYLHMNSIKSNGDITFIHDRERKDIHIHQYLL